MQTIPQAFQEFLSKLELTDSEREKASDQHTYLRTQLQQRLSVADNFLSGSYARHTAIRPLHDIDVFLVLDGTRKPNEPPSAVLSRIQSTLDTIYPGKSSVRQSRSVNIEFTGTGIAYDVVPAYRVSEGVYEVPDRDVERWIRTNPKVHAELSTKANEQSGKFLKPLVKAIKHAKQVHGADVRSFHLEVLACRILTRSPDSNLDGLVTLLDGLATQVTSPCPDPAKLGPDIQPNEERCRKAKTWLDGMATLARDARQLARDGKVGEAHAKLRELFGDRWPERGVPTKPGAPAVVVSGSSVDDPGSRFG